ncbi:hypothetical protein [Leeuwenhoekiella sp. W20_SRS_FM14]|uniref:hypothetical protein n=1 Tax=Leeuwenhoekiella sp. W20_SRS_FM14 TaxID=3240270 RepID=UPI003F99848C
MNTSKTSFALIVVLLFLGTIYSQKRLEYRIPSNLAKGVFVASDDVFEIFIKTTDTKNISVRAEVEGETFETIIIDPVVENGLWLIKISRSLGFEAIDDKLAAHKVVSIVLHIELPKDKEVWVNSSLASVQARGNYKYINMNLSGGDCKLFDFCGSGIINTLRGAIEVETRNTRIEALTRNGIQKVATRPNGKYHLKLKSVDGNISVSQSQ